MRNNWSVMTNFLYNWDRDRGFVQNPNQERFNDNTVTNWAFKIVGTYRAPWGIVVSPVAAPPGRRSARARRPGVSAASIMATGVTRNTNSDDQLRGGEHRRLS